MDRDNDRESVVSNGSEISTGALQSIREQMAISLNRMRHLEEQVKLVPQLQVGFFVTILLLRVLGQYIFGFSINWSC